MKVTPMENEHQRKSAPDALHGEDRVHIAEVFENEVVPRLRRFQARVGILSCGFAGEQYRNWVIHFRSAGSGFSIVEFEYDEDAAEIDLGP